ncbi:SCP2 sterol-binding domain-containing protein [Amycolatopsis sp. K13G38]|uniref:SCP2 sterol-binding domain-containing protein n=1 Tax=Amycolatopsis acididurans TaxID=2724524 RepID=A0ABX1J370_9PSEU|nr:SCP2 sterol-binding domain-containing protein [Amycolatopsis acididurans]NKQ54218.1 SCP2 sterol-binding domain-containing protein [Amycolatopsis acididurans]
MSFRNEDEARRYIGGIFETAFKDEEIGPKLVDTGLVLRFAFTDPEAVLVIDMGQQQVYQGDGSGLTPSATMSMKCETANAYWQGKVNLPFAMARGKIAVDGNVASLLKLAPLGKKLYPVYIDNLTNDGRTDLLV